MTDNTQWQSPENARSNGPQPPDGAAQGSHGLPPRGAPGWTPPPRAGLIPLRPLDVGTIVGAPFTMLRRNPRPTFGASLLVQLIVQILTAAVVTGVAAIAFSRVTFDINSPDSLGSTENSQLFAGAVAVTALSAVIPALLGVLATGVMQGLLVLEVSRETLGEKLSFRQLWARGRGRLLAVAGYQLLVSAGTIGVVGVFAGIVALIIVAGNASAAAIVIGVLVGLVGGLGIAVLFVWIGTKIAFVPSIMMLERLTMGAALRRSWRLTRGAFWKVFGVTLLVAVVLNFASSIASAPLQFLSPIATSIFSPTGDDTGAIVVLVVGGIITVALTLSVGAIVLVAQSSTAALLYLDQRMRKEGLDLELSRYVEGRQTGADLADPYLRTTPGSERPTGPAGGAGTAGPDRPAGTATTE